MYLYLTMTISICLLFFENNYVVFLQLNTRNSGRTRVIKNNPENIDISTRGCLTKNELNSNKF